MTSWAEVCAEKDNAETRSTLSFTESSPSFVEIFVRSVARGFAEKMDGAVTASNEVVSNDLVLVLGVYSFQSAAVRF